MGLKSDTKFGGQLNCHFEIDIRNLTTNFDPSTWKSQNLHFNGHFLSKVYNVGAKKPQRSYVW